MARRHLLLDFLFFSPKIALLLFSLLMTTTEKRACRKRDQNYSFPAGSVENAECGVRSAECGKCGVWKMRSVENAECGKCGVWKVRSVESAECGK